MSTLPIVPVYPRQLSRYSSLAVNGKMASFSAASCWCGVIWIWRYQRHNTARDGTDSAYDTPARLLRPDDLRLSWQYHVPLLRCSASNGMKSGSGVILRSLETVHSKALVRLPISVLYQLWPYLVWFPKYNDNAWKLWNIPNLYLAPP